MVGPTQLYMVGPTQLYRMTRATAHERAGTLVALAPEDAIPGLHEPVSHADVGRIAALEASVAQLAERLHRLESGLGAPVPAPEPAFHN